MDIGKYIKTNKHKRSDANSYVIMQCITSFFIIILINIMNQIDNYSDTDYNFWIFIRTSFVFLGIKLFNIKCDKFSINKIYILIGCLLFDFFLYQAVFTDNSLLFDFITFSTGAYLPFFVLSLFKKFCYHKTSIEIPLATKILYLKYWVILIILLLLNFIIPAIICLLFAIAQIEVIFVIFVLYQVIFSKFMPLIAFFVAILLQKKIFYTKKIAPFLAYIIVFGSIFDITLYTKFSNSLFSIKEQFIIPISFIATFLPMYFVNISTVFYKKLFCNRIIEK